MINYEDFVSKYYSNSNEFRKKDIKRFVDNLSEIIGDTPLTDALRNEQLLCRAFSVQGNACGVSRSHYQKFKEYLLNLFDFYNIEGKVPSRETVIDCQQNIGYFRGINEILEFIDSVGKAHLQNYNPTQDLVIIKSICVLGWLGFSTKEIAEFKKSDLHMLGYDTYLIRHEDEEYRITGEPFAALYYLSNLESYRGLPGGKIIHLNGDQEYLFRSTSKSDKLLANSITSIIVRFNTQIPTSSSQKAIIFRNLHKNALFIDVYNDTSDRSLIAKISDILHCDQNYAISYKEQYLRFVDAIEDNEI